MSTRGHALVNSLRWIVAHNPSDRYLLLTFIKPRLETPQTALRTRGVLWQIKPGIRRHVSSYAMSVYDD